MHASRELVWEGWTKPEHIARWWGPKGWRTTVYEMDVRPGGVWHFCMKPDDGEGDEVWARAIYHEVVRPSYITYIEGLSNADGHAVDSSQQTVTVEFLELEHAMTRLIIRMQFTTIAELDAMEAMGMVEGFAEALDRLEAFILNSEQ